MNELCWDPCLVGERFTPTHRRAPFGRVPPARCCEDYSPCCSPPEPACSPHRANCSPAKDFFARRRQEQDDSQSELDIKIPKTCETHILDHMRCSCIACMKLACMWRQGVKKTLRSKIKNHLCSNNSKAIDKTCNRPQKCPKKRGICPKRNVSPSRCRRNCSPQFKPCFQVSPQIDHLCSPRLNQKGCGKFYAGTGSPTCGCPDPCACRNVCPRGGRRHFGEGEKSSDGYCNVAMDGTWGDSKLCDKPADCRAAALRAAAVDDCISHRCFCPGLACSGHDSTPSTIEIKRQDCDIISPPVKYDFGCLESMRKSYSPRKAGSDHTLENNSVSETTKKAKNIPYTRSQQWYQDLCCTKEPIKADIDLDKIRSLISSVALKTSDVLEGSQSAKENAKTTNASLFPESMLAHSPYMNKTLKSCMAPYDNSMGPSCLDGAKSYLGHLGCSLGPESSMYFSQRLQNNSCLLKPVKSDEPWKLKGVFDTLNFETPTTKEAGDSMTMPYIKKYCGDSEFHDSTRSSFYKSLDLRLERILSQTFENVHKPPNDITRQIGIDGCLTDFPTWVPTYKKTETSSGKEIHSPYEHLLGIDLPKTSGGVSRDFTGTLRRWNQYTEADARDQTKKVWHHEHKPESNGELTKIPEREIPSRGIENWESGRTSMNCYHSTRDGLLEEGYGNNGILNKNFEQQNGLFNQDANVPFQNAIREDDGNVAAKSTKSELTFEVQDKRGDENDHTNERVAASGKSKPREYFSRDCRGTGSPTRKQRPEKDIGRHEEYDSNVAAKNTKSGLTFEVQDKRGDENDHTNERVSASGKSKPQEYSSRDARGTVSPARKQRHEKDIGRHEAYDSNVAAKNTKSRLTFEVQDKRGDENDHTYERVAASGKSKPRAEYSSKDARGTDSPARKQRPEKDVVRQEYVRRRHGVEVGKGETGESDPKENKDILTEETDVFHTARSSIDDEPRAEMDNEGAKDVTLDDISESFGSCSYPGEGGGQKMTPSPERNDPQPTPRRYKLYLTPKLGESLENNTTTGSYPGEGGVRKMTPSPKRNDPQPTPGRYKPHLTPKLGESLEKNTTTGSYPGEGGGRKITPSPKRNDPQPTPKRYKHHLTPKVGKFLENNTTTAAAEATEKSRNRQIPERRDFFRRRNVCPVDNNKDHKVKFKDKAKFHEKIDILLPANGLGTTSITSFDISPGLCRKKTGRYLHKELDDVHPRWSPCVSACEKRADFWRGQGASPGAAPPPKSPMNGLFRPPKRKTPLLASDRVLREPVARTEGEWLLKHTRLMNECVRERQDTSRARVQRLVRRTEDVRESVSDLSINLDKMEKQLENVRTLQQGYIRRAISAVRLLEKKRDRHSANVLDNCYAARNRRPDLGPRDLSDSPEGLSSKGASLAKVTQGLRGLVARTKTGRNIRELDELYSYFVNNDNVEGGDWRRENIGSWTLTSQKSHRKSRQTDGKHDIEKGFRDEPCWVDERTPPLRAETCSAKREAKTRTYLKARNACPRRKDVSVNFSKMISAARSPEETSDSAATRDTAQSGYETEEETDTERGDTFRVRPCDLGVARMLGVALVNGKEVLETRRRLKSTASSPRKTMLGEPQTQGSLGNRSRSAKPLGKNRNNDGEYWPIVGGTKPSDVSNSRLNTTFTISEI